MLTLVFFLLPACLTEDNFPDRVANASCDWLLDCEEADFNLLYEDRADCEDDVTSYMEDLQSQAEAWNCVFDEDNAHECLDALQDATCSVTPIDDLVCMDVWDCPVF